MRFSLPLGRIAGIDIRLHLTFFLLFLWVASVVLGQGGSAATVIAESAFVVLVFGCVLLHELGHALAARVYGIKTRDIVLLPIGGVARLEDIPEKPSQELVVVAAGPAVNAVLAVGALALLPFFGGSLSVSLFEGALLPRLALVNVAMVVFNLIPAFPMDGGRILRALLAFRLERTQATRIAGRVGRGFALLFALFGLFANPILVLIALFHLVRRRAGDAIRPTEGGAQKSHRQRRHGEEVPQLVAQ